MNKTHVMLQDARCLLKWRKKFGAEQVEIAYQNSIPVLVVEPGANELGICLINYLALLWVLHGPTTPKP